MKTVKEKCHSVFEIKKSIFHSIVAPVTTKEEVSCVLEQVKRDYPNATHYCLAYIIGQEKYATDDHEPSGTAGQPMLHVLEMKQLDQVCCIVVRYYGGIQLGTGGLVRAYQKAVQEGLKEATLLELIPGYQIEIHTTYENSRLIEHFFKDYILKKSYLEIATFILEAPAATISLLEEKHIQYLIIKSIDIKKK